MMTTATEKVSRNEAEKPIAPAVGALELVLSTHLVHYKHSLIIPVLVIIS